jgi:serine phosphatase RsbU (regulator of sigma subunit)
VLALALPYLAYPFGILAAGMYVQNGLVTFLFLTSGLLLVALLARRLSLESENNRQRTRQLEQMEHLSLDIISGPPDGTALPAMLAEHVPAMFPSARVIIWVEPDNFLLRHPPEWNPSVEEFWEWMQTQTEAHAFTVNDDLPWRQVQSPHNPLVVAPILNVETNAVIGWMYIQLQLLAQPWNRQALHNLFPGVRTLSTLVANTLHQVTLYNEMLEQEYAMQELKLAGEIQASFFPDEIPVFPGWEFAVTLLPARETSGDFFDFIPLEGGKLGFLIADVTDKGLGPAIYMVLARTLIRTYAIEYEADPDVIFFATNERILKDARAGLFVTVFFGILDPQTATLTYCNAGHNPPFLVGKGREGVQALRPTGLPIGLDENVVWEKETIQLQAGDILVMYTDGIPDALNNSGSFFEEERLRQVVEGCNSCPAHQVQAEIMGAVEKFVNGADQYDDITLIVVGYEGEEAIE